MIDDPRLQELLDKLHDSDCTPEEVCDSCPELLPEVRERWRRMSRVRAEVDALFPPPANTETPTPTVPACDTHLPRVAGYEIESILGRGGMGVVFRARHLRLNRVVALKMALAGAYAGPSERQRFQREAEAAASLRHPNLVQIYDVGDSEGQPYFTMEYVEGESLAQTLSGTPKSGREAATLLVTLARAIQAAHDNGIVHRDLKPANILLSPDGTPKISDFGLARRMDGEPGLTRTGAVVGTPSYMAPEQARGQSPASEPSVDIYALGAILYELLTGRPPFRAETAAETVQQLLAQDPVSPSRLNGKIPGDLETICLKCLQKEPRRRYATAAALGDDLDRFLSGEAIAARPETRLGRLVRRVRRRPVLSAALLIATLSTAALVGGGVWTLSDRAAAGRDADDDLQKMAALLRKSSWPEARTALQRAKARLGTHSSPELDHRLEHGRRDLDWAERLDTIRMNSSSSIAGVLTATQADSDFAALFQEAGFGNEDTDPDIVAACIGASSIQPALVSAMYHWLRCRPDKRRRQWLIEVVVRADPVSTRWRDRVTGSPLLREKGAVATIVSDPTLADQSVDLLLNVYFRLDQAGQDPLPFLVRVQQVYPTDFWVNLTLGQAMRKAKNYPDAIRYGQAAVVLRPQAAVAHDYLGSSLRLAGRLDDAIAEHKEALRLDPTSPFAHTNLGNALSGLGHHEQAVAEFELAVRELPNDVGLRSNLGLSLEALGRLDEALEQYRLALVQQPTDQFAQERRRTLLVRQGRWDEVLAEWRKYLDSQPKPEDRVWAGYAECCSFRDREDDYRRACKLMLAQAESRTEPRDWEVAGRACLLLPPLESDLVRATALIDAALKTQPKNQGFYGFFLAAKGLAAYRSGNYEAAVKIMEGDAAGVLGPLPQLVVAMARWQLGQAPEARRALARAVESFDWSPEHADTADFWMYHVLRREAEAMIIPDLPAFLAGEYQPQDNDERLALLGVCQFRNLTAASARLYADAFAADPLIEEDYRGGRRYNAARVAALAGCGRGEDASSLPIAELAKWRAQAREWLRADLAGWRTILDRDPSMATRDDARQMLKKWQDDSNLRGLRDSAELTKLPEDEREVCASLWKELEVLLKRAEKGN